MPRYQFKSRLPIEITGEVEKGTSNILRVGGAKVTLGDIPFALFLRLVAELFKGAEQALRRLREAFIPALKDLPPNHFIERYRPKTLRLSTHPAFFTHNLARLFQHNSQTIQQIARKL